MCHHQLLLLHELLQDDRLHVEIALNVLLAECFQDVLDELGAVDLGHLDQRGEQAHGLVSAHALGLAGGLGFDVVVERPCDGLRGYGLEEVLSPWSLQSHVESFWHVLLED